MNLKITSFLLALWILFSQISSNVYAAEISKDILENDEEIAATGLLNFI